MKFDNKPNRTIIGPDGKLHWISRSMAVVVTIILNSEKVLVVKRGNKISASGKWCNPCGYLDWNESAEKCALREVWEETGIDLTQYINNEKSVSLMNYPWDIITDPSLNHNQDVAFYYGICIESENIPILTTNNSEDGEVADVEWIDIENIDRYEFAFNHDRRIKKFIDHVNKIKNGE